MSKLVEKKISSQTVYKGNFLDVKKDNVRVLFENDEVGFEHAMVTFNDGNKEAVMTYYRFKDGKVTHQETGATKLSQ